VERIITHPNYDNLSLEYDFALLHLGETIIMNDIVRPICLPRIDSYELVIRDK